MSIVYILNIETATKNCSVSVSRNGELVALKELSDEQFNHAEKLHVFISSVLEEAAIGLNDLQAIAVSKGPGSYTGLRIGVSAAKGLCYALNIPLIAVDTLKILAEAITVDNGFIVPMIDARRMEVFTQKFNAAKKAISVAEALILTADSFQEMDQTVHLCGDGALKCKEVLTNDKFVYQDAVVYPSAKEMCVLAYQKYLAEQFEDVAYFEPFYLKDFMLTTKKKTPI